MMKKKGPVSRRSLIGVCGVIAVLLLAAVLIIVGRPVDPQNPPEPVQYDYMVASSEVRDASGTLVHQASDFSSALGWATSRMGKIVYVPAGEYQINSLITLTASGVTLVGDGPEKTIFNFTDHTFVDYPEMPNCGFQVLDADNVQLEQLGIVGAGGVEIRVTSGTHSDYLIENVTVKNTAATLYHGFGVMVGPGATVNSPRFIKCISYDVAGDGFNLWGWGASGDIRGSGGWVKNALFEDCKALYSGYTSRIWDWAVGFDLAEGCNTDRTMVSNCEASYSWESGFHFEGEGYALKTTLQNCVADYNGQKYSDPRGAAWGRGYLFSLPTPADTEHPLGYGSDITMTNCIGSGNFGGTTGPSNASYLYTTPGYDYRVVESQVLDTSGSVAHEDSSFTAALKWAVGQPNVSVFVPEGHYIVSDVIQVASGVTLYGADSLYHQGNDGKLTIFEFPSEGDKGFLMQDVNNTHLFNLRIDYGFIEWKASDGVMISGNEAKGIVVYQTASTRPFAVGSFCGNASTISGLELGAVTVVNSHTDGFGFMGAGNASASLQHLAMNMCRAEGSGLLGPRDNMSVGYSFGDGVNMQDIIIHDCTAENSWNSGFCFNESSQMTSAVLEDCVSSGNGQKGDGANGMGYQLNGQGGVQLINCIGSGNAGPLR